MEASCLNTAKTIAEIAFHSVIAGVAVYGVIAWKKELVGKSKYKVAWDTLCELEKYTIEIGNLLGTISFTADGTKDDEVLYREEVERRCVDLNQQTDVLLKVMIPAIIFWRNPLKGYFVKLYRIHTGLFWAYNQYFNSEAFGFPLSTRSQILDEKTEKIHKDLEEVAALIRDFLKEQMEASNGITRAWRSLKLRLTRKAS